MIGYKDSNGDKDTYNLLFWKAFDIWKHHLNWLPYSIRYIFCISIRILIFYQEGCTLNIKNYL